MNMIRKISEGNATSMTLFLESKEIKFNLALVRDKKRNYRPLAYIFISEDGRYFDSPYSKGETGCGCNPEYVKKIDEFFHEEYEIISKDIKTIIQFVEKEEERIKEIERKEIEEKYKKIERINALPKEFLSSIPTVIFIREEAYFNPNQPFMIKGAKLTTKIIKNNQEQIIFIGDYIIKGNRLRVKKFAKEIWTELETEVPPKKALEILLKERNQIVEKIENA